MAKAKNKTVATQVDPADFVSNVEPEKKREDAAELLSFFNRVTGLKPKMWGPSIIGYGRYHYKYDSGREGEFMLTGFSPRKASQSIYVMPRYQDYSSILDRLGKYKIGKACLYVTRLDHIDTDVLRELIVAGLADLAERYPVKPS